MSLPFYGSRPLFLPLRSHNYHKMSLNSCWQLNLRSSLTFQTLENFNDLVVIDFPLVKYSSTVPIISLYFLRVMIEITLNTMHKISWLHIPTTFLFVKCFQSTVVQKNKSLPKGLWYLIVVYGPTISFLFLRVTHVCCLFDHLRCCSCGILSLSVGPIIGLYCLVVLL